LDLVPPHEGLDANTQKALLVDATLLTFRRLTVHINFSIVDLNPAAFSGQPPAINPQHRTT
jgi:hypothetical protein